MDGVAKTDHDAVHAAAVTYCTGLHTANVETFEALCHENFLMTAVATSGKPFFIDKSAFTARIGARDPFPGDPDFEILTIDVGG